ncbi:uncharacterized protein UHOD_11952 [Ustilago sp. UG-2017b]|nr:uncharacterized protein UHOD_11952 [Ustilago sp. UG-2017b]
MVDKSLNDKFERLVRGLAPETQVGLLGYSVTIKLRNGSGWRLWWLGTISIDMTVMMTPRSGVSVDDDEIDSIGVNMRVPSSSSTVQGAPLAPLLSSLSYVSSFDTAPPPQDLLAGLLYTAPPPSTGDGSFDSCLSSP